MCSALIEQRHVQHAPDDTACDADAVMMRVLTTSAGVVMMEASAPARPPMATTCHFASSLGFCPNASPAAGRHLPFSVSSNRRGCPGHVSDGWIHRPSCLWERLFPSHMLLMCAGAVMTRHAFYVRRVYPSHGAPLNTFFSC